MSIWLSYAQNREDLYINWLLDGQKKGFYVDVGANDPVVDSVTKFFYDKGWRGINIEPIKHHIEALQAARPRDINLHIGIAEKAGTIPFREYVGADGLSTMSPEMQHEQAAKYTEVRDYEVPTKPLAEVFGEHVPKGQSIDFLKVDVEGFEYEVLRSNDWKRFQPRLIVIEANHVKHDWRPILLSHGYSLLFFDGVNEYYGDRELAKKDVRATYPEMMIGPTALNIRQQEYVAWREDEVRQEDRRYYSQQYDAMLAEQRAQFERELDGLRQRVVQLEQQSALWFAARKLKRAHGAIRRKLIALQATHAAHAGVMPSGSPWPHAKPTPEVLTKLKIEDVQSFVPGIEAASRVSWRKPVFGTALTVYDAGVRTAKRVARRIRR